MVLPLRPEADPRSILREWIGERNEHAMNTVLYTQPLSLTYEQVRALLDLRICRASHENPESGQVVHCLKPAGHDHNHLAGYEWEACRWVAIRHNVRYPCIRPRHHLGGHDFGGWGINYTDWSTIPEPVAP